jgi:hypothetical protein
MSNINGLKAGCRYLVSTHSFARLESLHEKIGGIKFSDTIVISYIDRDYIIESRGKSLSYFILNIESPEPSE